MDLNLSKPQEKIEDRGATYMLQSMGPQTVRHDLVTENNNDNSLIWEQELSASLFHAIFAPRFL